jgi:tetratricopeptide (TPR) repeat protein
MSKRRKSAKTAPVVAPASPAPSSPRGRWRGLVLGVVLCLGALIGGWFWWHRGPEVLEGEDPVEDPRLTYHTPYRNVRPEVKYVGDEACASCHKETHRTYCRHSMGRSMALIEQVAPVQDYTLASHNPFEAEGRQYSIERQGNQVMHKEAAKDAQGQTVAQMQTAIPYVIGSGAHVYSYLFLRGEYVFQSPVSWYPSKKRWDLSPGFESLEDPFERPVRAECLYCHCDYVEPVKGTLNRYKLPLFPRGLSIGCERCHGPGEIHVNERKQNLLVKDEADYTIVNPRKLAPELREAVCQQCHLEGDRRLLRRGLQVFDYRPGLPLHLFWSVFAASPDLADHGTFAGHVEQMHASRCFKKSKGEMGCITCHDAHLPLAETKVTHYRQQCVNCHHQQEQKLCSEPLAERQRKNQDNCIACHMTRRESTDIRHTAITDHRILRKPAAPRATQSPRRLQKGEVPLVHFHADLVSDKDKPEVERDLGLALTERAKYPTPVSRQLGELALPYVEAALRRWPRDASSLEALAFLQMQRGQPAEALATVEQVLARAPERESALADAAQYADKAGDLAKAIAYARRAVAVDPWHIGRRIHLTELLLQQKEYDAALTQCQEVLAFNPGSIRMRTLLAGCYQRTGQTALAQAEFDKVLRRNPPNKDELRQWFERQKR